jgi:hypothetical protein
MEKAKAITLLAFLCTIVITIVIHESK